MKATAPTAFLLAASLVACAGPSGGAPAARPSPPPSPKAQASASAGPAPAASSPAPPGTPSALGLRLPGRLGLALPASLVGAQAHARLAGAEGLVGAQGSQIVALADGRIVSNNSGALVSNNSGALISDHGSGRRLAQADAVATLAVANPTQNPKMQLWLLLALVDLDDQLLQSFLAAKPTLGAWRRFPAGQPKILPLPVTLPLFDAVALAFTRLLGGLHFAGHVAQEGGQLRLRIVSMPQADTPLAEATPVFDLQASGDAAVARSAFMPELLQVFGLTNAAARVAVRQGPWGPELDALVAESSLSRPGPGTLQAVLNPGFQDNTRRRVLVRPSSATSAQAFVASRSRVISLLEALPLRDRRNFLSIGYDPSQASRDRGLVAYKRESFWPIGQDGGYLWLNPLGEARPASSPLWPLYILPEGFYAATGPAELQRLLVPFQSSDEALMPQLPAEAEDPAADGEVRPDPLGPELLAAPESP